MLFDLQNLPPVSLPGRPPQLPGYLRPPVWSLKRGAGRALRRADTRPETLNRLLSIRLQCEDTRLREQGTQEAAGPVCACTCTHTHTHTRVFVLMLIAFVLLSDSARTRVVRFDDVFLGFFPQPREREYVVVKGRYRILM